MDDTGASTMHLFHDEDIAPLQVPWFYPFKKLLHFATVSGLLPVVVYEMEICLLAEPAVEWINNDGELEVFTWSPWVRHEVSVAWGSVEDEKYGSGGGVRLGGPVIRSLVFQTTGPHQPEMHISSTKTGVQGLLISDKEMVDI